MNRYVTVFTDASFCPNTKVAGWAAWIKHDEPARTERLSGVEMNVAGSNDAEVLALKEALSFIEDNIALEEKVVVIQADCQSAIQAIKDRAMALKDRGAVFVKMKWVKGHQGVRNPRSAVNTWCDKQARSLMREVRDNIYRDTGVCDTQYGPKPVMPEVSQ